MVTNNSDAVSARASGVLAGKRILITGVLTPKSIAYSIADACQQHGADIVLTSFGRAMSLTERSAKRLEPHPDVLEMDVVDVDQVHGVAAAVRERWGSIDGVVHAIGFAPEDCLGGHFMETPWSSVATAMQVSSFSLKTLAAELVPLMPSTGGALVALTFDGTLAWPLYDWMGPAKAALEAIGRYLARDLGPRHVRVNTISAGPLETIAAKSIPGFRTLKDAWSGQAPLGWDATDAGPVADTAVFLLSDMARAISGEVIHVDGGYHSQGAPLLTSPEQPGEE
ncbi:MAG: enoyl-[acyl-carrier-protein] reductase FabI [Candidatus Aeolococcus gillhamiae]|uniref:Enoyl-[acyl-carrier-protein] reductase [NADH] n=1 Tax=Candidatus Aeolococcus gillhamiae TaxID=3127015 RepID=A0A2W5Z8Z5_9BACT|nr:MAG: enoyl-[acyl-carrier-protein] reductase FabI [Candidatus Dormibacter sp. RRmetagenome_bin12]